MFRVGDVVEKALSFLQPQSVDVLLTDADAPEALRQRLAHELQRAVHHRRKAAFDEVFIAHGRARRSDLLLANWYHKYDFNPGDERSLLSALIPHNLFLSAGARK